MLKTQRTAQGAAHREIRYHIKILHCLKHGTEVENTAFEVFFSFFYYFSACNMFLKSQECTETLNSDSQNLKPLHVAVLIPSMHFSLSVSIAYNQILN